MQLITRDLIENVLEQARRSPRLRMNHNFHTGPADNPHRFLNVLMEGTYIRPHRHLDPPKAESFLVLEGQVTIFLFDDDGRVTSRQPLGPPHSPIGIDLPPGVWHTLAVMTPHAVCYEVKPGPYAPLSDKEFAPWAPKEDDSAASEYLARLLIK